MPGKIVDAIIESHSKQMSSSTMSIGLVQSDLFKAILVQPSSAQSEHFSGIVYKFIEAEECETSVRNLARAKRKINEYSVPTAQLKTLFCLF